MGVYAIKWQPRPFLSEASSRSAYFFLHSNYTCDLMMTS